MAKKAEMKGGRQVLPELAFDPVAAALKQLYDDVASEDIPDDFLALIDQLDDNPKKPKSD